MCNDDNTQFRRPQQITLNIHRVSFIQRGCPFIKKNILYFADQTASQGNALALTAGKKALLRYFSASSAS